MAHLTYPDGADKQIVKTALAAILNMFKTGEVAPALARIARTRIGVPADGWSFRNRLLLMVQGSDDARTFKAWGDVGRFVKPAAERLRDVWIWEPLRRTGTNADGDKYTYTYGFKASRRYRFEDTGGADLPAEQRAALPEPMPLSDVAEIFGLRVTFGHGVAGAWGWYDPSSKEVRLFTDDTRVFFHELAHAAHHRILTRRGKEIVRGQDLAQEAVAEITAAVLAEIYGSATSHGNSYEYVTRYAQAAGRDAAEVAMDVISDVEQVLKEILG